MNRRSFFATLAAPFLARFAQRPAAVIAHEALKPGDIFTMDVIYLPLLPLSQYRREFYGGADFEFSSADALFDLNEISRRYS